MSLVTTSLADSPKKTSDLCIEAVDLIVEEMEKMEEDRRKFTEEINPKKIKERVKNNAK